MFPIQFAFGTAILRQRAVRCFLIKAACTMAYARNAAGQGLRRRLYVIFGMAASIGVAASASRADILYVSTQFRDIDKITSAGEVSVFAKLLPPSVYPSGLAFDGSGNLFATDPNRAQINRISPDGTVNLFKSLSSGSFPAGLAMDSGDNLYVANIAKHEINKITPAGALSQYALLPAGLEMQGLAFDARGNLYVAASNTDQIYKVSNSGMVSLFATLPTNSGPFGLAFDAGGTLFAAHFLSDQISRISTAGIASPFATLPLNSQPAGLAFDSNGDLFVADVPGYVHKITTTGEVDFFATATNSSLFIAVTDNDGHPLQLPPTLQGDTNADGIVDIGDLNNVRNNFGSTGLGDTDGNGTVDIADLNNVRNNFGAGQPAAVPEPSAYVLTNIGLIGMAGVIWRRQRR